MKLSTIQNLRSILTSNQITVRGDQINVVVDAIADLNAEEALMKAAEKAKKDAETEKRVTELADKRIKEAIEATEKELPSVADLS